MSDREIDHADEPVYLKLRRNLPLVGVTADEPTAPPSRDLEHSIVTFTGKRVWPLDPREEDIDIRDIAHSLAHSCRFTGHVRDFYSVGQHCLLAADKATQPNKLTALLHDASEAYLSDIARPVKRQDGFKFYKEIEAKLEAVIATKFRMVYPPPPEIKEIDSRLLLTEQRDLMPPSSKEGWPKGLRPYDQTIKSAGSKYVERKFLEQFVLLTTGLHTTIRTGQGDGTDDE
jgi:hypothetical protein